MRGTHTSGETPMSLKFTTLIRTPRLFLIFRTIKFLYEVHYAVHSVYCLVYIGLRLSVRCTSGLLEAASPSNSRIQYIFLCKLSRVLIYAVHVRLCSLEIRITFHCCSQCNDRIWPCVYFPGPVILNTILANRVSRGTIAYGL